MTDNYIQQTSHKGSIEPGKFRKMIAECAYYKAEKMLFKTAANQLAYSRHK